MGRGKGKARVRRGKRKRVPKFVSRDKMLSHREGRVFVHMLGLKSCKEWREFCKSGQRPLIIPSRPDRVYKGKGWVSYPDWLGYERKSKMLDFAAARAVARQCNLKSKESGRSGARAGSDPPTYRATQTKCTRARDGSRGLIGLDTSVTRCWTLPQLVQLPVSAT